VSTAPYTASLRESADLHLSELTSRWMCREALRLHAYGRPHRSDTCLPLWFELRGSIRYNTMRARTSSAFRTQPLASCLNDARGDLRARGSHPAAGRRKIVHRTEEMQHKHARQTVGTRRATACAGTACLMAQIHTHARGPTKQDPADVLEMPERRRARALERRPAKAVAGVRRFL
jgi:hypothetical protein